MWGNRGMVMERENVWNLGGMEKLTCIRAGIWMSICVLVLVAVVVLVWMVLTVGVVVEVLAVVVATVMMQGVLVGIGCVTVVSGSSSGGFVVMVALEGFGLMLWSS